MNDRSYYRALPTQALVEAARESGHELAIALGERLSDLYWELETGSLADFRNLSAEYDRVCSELAECRDELRNNEHIYEG